MAQIIKKKLCLKYWKHIVGAGAQQIKNRLIKVSLIVFVTLENFVKYIEVGGIGPCTIVGSVMGEKGRKKG